MTFDQLYSSSSGNLYMVTASNGKRLMIECGVTWPKIQKALNFDLSGIVGCLVSHEHKDHSKAVKEVMASGIDVFASELTFGALGVIQEISPNEFVRHRRAKVIEDKSVIRFGKDFRVRAFATNHDAAEPLGFLVHEIETKENLLFATDTSHIKQQFNIKFSIIAIGVSYDKDILQKRVDAGDINKTVAERLLTSHMEKREAMRYIEKFCDLSRCREIHLLHMSGDNIDKIQTKTDFEKKFFIETRIVESANTPGKVNS